MTRSIIILASDQQDQAALAGQLESGRAEAIECGSLALTFLIAACFSPERPVLRFPHCSKKLRTSPVPLQA